MTSTLLPAHTPPPARAVGSSPAAPPTTTAAQPDLSLARRLSTALALIGAVAAGATAFIPGILREHSMWAGNARGTAVVILVVAVPTLVASMALATRGSVRARVAWVGALAYLVYNFAIFAFAVAFNELFLLYVASLSLAVWSLVALLARTDARDIVPAIATRTLERAVGVYLVVIAIAFAALWLSDIVPALLAHTAPAALRGTSLLTNPVHVMDLAFALPLAALGGVLLWRGRPLGYLISGVLLVMLTIEGISVATDQYFGHLADSTQPLTAVPMFIVLTLVGLVPTVALLRAMERRPGT
jgi:hypothetical protein